MQFIPYRGDFVRDVARALHHEAMDLMADHDRLKRDGQDAEARRVALSALQLEKRALETSLTEPFRSYVYRSAASIALDAGQLDDTLALVDEALAGDEVPEVISLQLKEIVRTARERK